MESEFGQYMKEMGKGKTLPNDPYEHSTLLIEAEKENVKNFSEILDKFWLLGNVKDDKLIRVYQREIGLLTELLDMATREDELANMFQVLYYKGRSEFSITRNKDGTERNQQANAAWRYQPTQGQEGYGVLAQQVSTPEEQNFLSNVFKRR